MTICTKEGVKTFLLTRYSGALSEHGIKPDQVPDSFDFLEQGILDSLGIMDMISGVEKEFNLELDLENLDPEKLPVLGAFSEYVAAFGKGE